MVKTLCGGRRMDRPVLEPDHPGVRQTGERSRYAIGCDVFESGVQVGSQVTARPPQEVENDGGLDRNVDRLCRHERVAFVRVRESDERTPSQSSNVQIVVPY